MMIFLLTWFAFLLCFFFWVFHARTDVQRSHYEKSFPFFSHFSFSFFLLYYSHLNKAQSMENCAMRAHHHIIVSRTVFQVILRDEGAKGNHFMLIGYFHVTISLSFWRWACDFMRFSVWYELKVIKLREEASFISIKDIKQKLSDTQQYGAVSF
jgi:hypothetical protein